MLISKLVSNEKIQEAARRGSIASLDGRCYGETTATAMRLIGDAMKSTKGCDTLYRSPNQTRAIDLKAKVDELIHKLGLLHLTSVRRGVDVILTYDIFYSASEVFQIAAGAREPAPMTHMCEHPVENFVLANRSLE